MPSSLDPYAVLGVAPDASADELKRAYRARARELHPDHNPGDPEAEARFKDLAQAWEIVGDPDKRQEWHARTGGRPPPPRVDDDWLDTFDWMLHNVRRDLDERALPALAAATLRGPGHAFVLEVMRRAEGGTLPLDATPSRAAVRRTRRRLRHITVVVADGPAFDLVSLRAYGGSATVALHPQAFFSRGFREPEELRPAMTRLLAMGIARAVAATARLRPASHPAVAEERDDEAIAQRRRILLMWAIVGVVVAAMFGSAMLARMG